MLRIFRLIFLGDAHRHHYIDKDVKEVYSNLKKSVKKIIYIRECKYCGKLHKFVITTED